jgi:hypothetical protein
VNRAKQRNVDSRGEQRGAGRAEECRRVAEKREQAESNGDKSIVNPDLTFDKESVKN